MSKKITRTKSRSRRKSAEVRGKVDQIDSAEQTVQLSLPIAEILAGVSDAVERVTAEAGMLIDHEVPHRRGGRGPCRETL